MLDRLRGAIQRVGDTSDIRAHILLMCLSLFLWASTAIAQLPQRLKLVYQAPEGAYCPSEGQLRKALARCLKPVSIYLADDIMAGLRLYRSGRSVDGDIFLRNNRGRISGTRRIEGRGRSCRPVARDAILALCFSLERMGESGPGIARAAYVGVRRRTRRLPVPYHRLPYPSDPIDTVAIDTDTNPVRTLTSASANTLLGLSSTSSLGPSVGLSVGQSRWHLELSAIWTGRTSREIQSGGSITFESWLLRLTGFLWLTPRDETVVFATSIETAAGWLWATPNNINTPRIAREPLLFLGPGVAVDFPLHRMFFIRIRTSALMRLVAPDIAVTQAEQSIESVFTPWPVVLAIEAGIVVRLF
ncbi:MAG: hypothetical protein VX223_18495 [Myxococcota bacterium]|nr:hypothetical protein [Myxococcota bacterium]